MTSAKQEILKRIRDAQILSDAPTSVEVTRDYLVDSDKSTDEIRDMFIERVEDYGAVVKRCSEAELSATIAAALAERGAREVVYAPGVPEQWLSAVDGTARADDTSRDPRYLDDVDAVVTDSHSACAETGTVTLESGPECGRRALTLIPDRHICIVRTERIVHRMPEMIRGINPDSPATMFAGPSATSDIELSRVDGVHGPRDLVVIVVD